MRNDRLEVRAATVDDTATVMSLLEEASGWLAGRKSDQWQRTEHRLIGVVRDIGCRTLFLVLDGPAVVGTITVDKLADTDFWQRSDRVRTALYVHRMAVCRDRAGEGIGSAMLDWAGTRARKRGRDKLRLDAWRTNPDLHKYYEKQGFRWLRTEDVAGRGSGALFERPSDVRTNENLRIVWGEPTRAGNVAPLASPHG